ncbi:MAG: alpha/beta hydrolase [Vicinamibacterales bacterium]
MSEMCSLFGGSRHLAGTLCVPDDRTPEPVAFVLFNAGVIHRIGPHRFNVKLARALAASGFSSLRFDLSGQGDSQREPTFAPLAQQAVADVRAAMDHLERTVGVKRFVIAGMCSGANHGLSAAHADGRVVGLWMYDGFHYPTPKTRRLYYQNQLQSQGVSGVCRWLVRRVTALGRRSQGNAPKDVSEYWQDAPPREVYGATLRDLVTRNVDIFMVQSGSFPGDYNYADQFLDGFREFVGEAIRCDFEPTFDHTVTTVDAQRRVIASLLNWAQRFSEAPRNSAAGK